MDLDLNSNNFNGSVHLDFIARLGNLSFLDLSYNNWTVHLSSSLPPNLDTLRLVSCNISSTIPNFGKELTILDLDDSNYRVLDLSDNSLSGRIQSCLFDTELDVLNLRNNRLHGTLPDTFSSNCSLQTLSLSGNLLRGGQFLNLLKIARD